MNCNETRRHWELYHDSEGDGELYLRINDHLAECPQCAKWFYQQAHFEELLAGKLSNDKPSEELWQKILDHAGVAPAVSTRNWSFFGPFFALAASVLLVVSVWFWIPQSEAPHLSALAAVAHQQFAERGRPIEFSSESDIEVERYLKARVPFAVRCPPREDAGFAVRGGGVCDIAGDAAAYVVGRVEGGDISIFILPEYRLNQFTHERDVLNRETVHHCREREYDMVVAKIDHNVVVVIGHGKPEQLEKVVRAYGTYPEAPSASGAQTTSIPDQPLSA